MADGPFREDALALATTEADATLARWRAAPVSVGTRLALLVLGPLYAAARGGPGVARRDEIADAERAGLRFLGRHRFAAIIPFFGPVRESWTDADGLVHASFRRAIPRGPIEAAMGHYVIATHFDDDTNVFTSSKPELASDPRNIRRAGTGRFLDDYRSHRAAVLEHAQSGRRALRVGDLRTALALSTWNDRVTSPSSIVTVALARVGALGLVALAVAFLARFL